MTDYKKRLKILLDGDDVTEFVTKSGTHIATGYIRIVIGKRGPYIEFSDGNINKNNIYIPEYAFYRVHNNSVYYLEYRTLDESYVKVYFQKKLVDYADYKVGFYYVSPFDLKTKDLDELITPIKKKNKDVQ